MKADKIELCGLCGRYIFDFSIDRILNTGTCLKLNCPALGNEILPDCPLPDWPSVSMDKIRIICGFSPHYIADELRSIGVEIVEEKDGEYAGG